MNFTTSLKQDNQAQSKTLASWFPEFADQVDASGKAVSLYAYLRAAGAYEITPCIVRVSRRLVFPGCWYKQDFTHSSGTAYTVHHLAVLGAIPKEWEKILFEQAEDSYYLCGYYKTGHERFAPLGPMFFLEKWPYSAETNIVYPAVSMEYTRCLEIINLPDPSHQH